MHILDISRAFDHHVPAQLAVVRVLDSDWDLVGHSGADVHHLYAREHAGQREPRCEPEVRVCLRLDGLCHGAGRAAPDLPHARRRRARRVQGPQQRYWASLDLSLARRGRGSGEPTRRRGGAAGAALPFYDARYSERDHSLVGPVAPLQQQRHRDLGVQRHIRNPHRHLLELPPRLLADSLGPHAAPDAHVDVDVRGAVGVHSVGLRGNGPRRVWEHHRGRAGVGRRLLRLHCVRCEVDTDIQPCVASRAEGGVPVPVVPRSHRRHSNVRHQLAARAARDSHVPPLRGLLLVPPACDGCHEHRNCVHRRCGV
eukprot:PhM_4_TR19062/c0_g1_i1/m.103256